MIVVDASVVVEFLFAGVECDEVARRIVDPAHEVAAPHLLDTEVANVVRRRALAAEISHERGLRAIHDLAALNVVRWPHDLLLTRIWGLRHNLTAYDAAYVALAEVLDAELLTCDRSIAVTPGIHCHVELVG